MYVYVYTHTHVCMYMYYLYIYIYIHTHTHTHIYIGGGGNSSVKNTRLRASKGRKQHRSLGVEPSLGLTRVKLLKPSRAYSPLGHHQRWHPVVSPVGTPVLLTPSRAYSPLGHHQR